MDFGLSDDQSLFQESLRRYLTERVPTDRVRQVMESETGHDASLLTALAEQGVSGILVDPEHGGSGLGLLDAALAAEELGRAAAPYSYHSAGVMAPLLLGATDDATALEWLGKVATGEALVSVIFDGEVTPDGKLTGTAAYAPDAANADLLLVFPEGSDSLYLVAPDAAGMTVTPLVTIDTTRRLAEVVFDGVAASSVVALSDAAALRERVQDAGRVALAADALGAAERGLETAIEYAMTREQFGRPVASFQSVKHMCAESFAEMEPVRSLLWYAAFAWDEEQEDSAYMASLVKSHGSEMATESTTTSVQVYGGMGFTYECDMQIWFKRAGYDRQVLGSPTELRARAAALYTA